MQLPPTSPPDGAIKRLQVAGARGDAQSGKAQSDGDHADAPDDATEPAHESQASAATRAQAMLHALARYPLPFSALGLLGVAGILWLVGLHSAAQYPLIVVGVIGGLSLLWDTVRQLLRREVGVDLLALLAIAGSLALGQYLAGAVIVLMMASGEALEAFALRRANRSLTALAERAPRTAHIVRGAEIVTIPAGDVERGMEVMIKPGEIIPVDGVVTQGASSVNEADLTGESRPVRKEVGALTLSGSVNLDAPLYVQATKRSAESQYAQIVHLVEEAQRRKAPIHRLADRYAVGFTVVALVIAGLAWLISRDSIYALAVLVVATPCPLILATPIAIMSGVDAAAHRGVIVKSGATIEQLSEVKVAVFDKTGTLTMGSPQLITVQQWIPPTPHVAAGATTGATPTYTTDQLLQLAAAIEQFSPHVLARAVVDAARARQLPFTLAQDVRETPGKGASGRAAAPGLATPPADATRDAASQRTSATVPNQLVSVAVGNRTFMRSLDIPLPTDLLAVRERLTSEGLIASFLALDGQVCGLLIFADAPRPELARLAPALQSAGIDTIALLTGDGPVIAEQVGALVGADRVVALCLPEDKVRIIAEYERQGRHTLMVGDGVNDAPALASATVGVAMGAQGLSAASSAADAVLLSSNLLQVADVARLGRQVVRVATLGIWIGMGLSVVAMIIAAIGWLPPTAGAFLQEGIDAVVILNALRAGRMANAATASPHDATGQPIG